MRCVDSRRRPAPFHLRLGSPTLLRRHYRINLPIQVWHLGQSEMSEEMRLLLADMDVEIVDAATIVARHPARVAGGWPLKPYALMNSRFREVLYLDADTVPLVDPRALFEWDIFRAEGLLMWPDILDLKEAVRSGTLSDLRHAIASVEA
jgi:alpha 1,2-mannosyltransferase